MYIDIDDAKTNLSKYIDKALKGEEIIITKNSKPLVRLVPYVEQTQQRQGGQLNK